MEGEVDNKEIGRDSEGREGGRGGQNEGREGEIERLHAKFHLNVFTVSDSGGQQLQSLAIFDIWGTPVATPFYR